MDFAVAGGLRMGGRSAAAAAPVLANGPGEPQADLHRRRHLWSREKSGIIVNRVVDRCGIRSGRSA